MTDYKEIKNISLIVAKPRIYGPGNFQVFARYGPTKIATVLNEAGFNVRLYDQSISPKLDLESIVEWSNLIGFSSKTSAISNVSKMISKIRFYSASRDKYIPIVLGGEHASMAPEHSLGYLDIDYLIMGEGDNSIVDLVNFLNQNITKPDYIKGIGYRVNEGFYLNFQRDVVEDFEDPIPKIELVQGLFPFLNSPKIKYFKWLWSLKNKSPLAISFQGSRGCPYACSFCPTITDLHGNKYRLRSIENGMNYLKEHIKQTGIKRVVFEDPLGVMDSPHFHKFFERLSKENLRMQGTILARIEIYNNPELLKKMKHAGIKNISLGFESLNEKTLKEYNKKISLNQIKESVDVIHKYGFSITGLFIVGSDSDTISDVYKIKDFIKKYGIEKWRISPLCQVLEKEGQLLPMYRFFTWNQFSDFGKELSDYCNGDFVFYYPLKIKPSELQQAIIDVNQGLCSAKQIVTLFTSTFSKRGIRPTIDRIATKVCYNIINKTILKSENYIEMLKQVEKGLYKGGPLLLEEKVKERYGWLISKKSVGLEYRNKNEELVSV